MKKFMLLLAAGLFFAVNASEEAVKEVLKDLKKYQMEMNGTQMLTLYHPAYVEIDVDGESSDYADLKNDMAELDAMRKVITRATLPEATLLEIVVAVFAMNESEISAELRESINELQNHADGKKLAAEAAETLNEINNIYIKTLEERWKSCEIISVAVEKESAVMVFRMKDPDGERLSEYTVDLIKVNNKWLIKKCVIK